MLKKVQNCEMGDSNSGPAIAFCPFFHLVVSSIIYFVYSDTQASNTSRNWANFLSMCFKEVEI